MKTSNFQLECMRGVASSCLQTCIYSCYEMAKLFRLLIYRKIFVGGIAYDVTNEDLSEYFSQYGDVAQAQVKYDRNTGRSRGFAFVEFTTGEACRAALNAREQSLKGKTVEVKPAKSRENKKVFVGGLPADHPGLYSYPHNLAADASWCSCS